jgi:ribonuclease HI
MGARRQGTVIFTDGACSGNPGPGGYAAIIVEFDADRVAVREQIVTGGESNTTNNRMEIRAAIEGLKAVSQPGTVTVVSDSQYVIYTMTKGWKRSKNPDLWAALDAAAEPHKVRWEYVRGHAGHEYNERCDQLAVKEVHKQKLRGGNM